MASEVKRNLFFNFVGDKAKLERVTQGATKALDNVERKTERLGRKMSGFGRSMTTRVGLPIAAAFAFGVKSIADTEKLLAQTGAVIESTGGAAGISAEEVLDLANEISGYSGVAHESIVEGENMLLTFKNIKNGVGEGNDVFNQATESLIDMSVAMGTDPKQAAIQLGKALNDPIAGISALSRVGITFTDDQKEMIEAMVESGDVMGAQKVILGELESQFGGSAAALGETMTGKINILKNSFEELARNLATFLIPVLQTLAGWLQGVADWFNNLSPGAQKFIGIAAAVVAALGPVLIVLGKLVGAFGKVMKAFKILSAVISANPYVLLIAATIAIVVLIVKNWDKIKAFLVKAWNAIKRVASTIWNGIRDLIKAVTDKVRAIVSGAWNTIRDTTSRIWGTIKDAVKRARDFLITLFTNFTLPGLILKHWDKIREGVRKLKEFIIDKWNAVVEFLKKIPGRIADVARGMWDSVKNGFRDAINAIIRAWNNMSFSIGGQHVGLPFGLGFTIPTITLRTPNLPYLHAGDRSFSAGVPGAAGLAMLRDGERVLSNAASAREKTPIIAQLVVDRKVIAEALIEYEEALT